MVRQAHRIVFIEIDSDNVAIPAYALSEELLIEGSLSFAWVVLECLITANGQVLVPRHIADGDIVDIGVLDQNEHIESQAERQDHDEVQDGSPRQDDSKGTALVLEQLILKRGKTSEVGAILHLIQAFGTSMNRCLCQTDQEGHQDKRKNAKE